MTALRWLWLPILLGCQGTPAGPGPGPGPGTPDLHLVTDQLTDPVFVTAPPGDTARLLVVEQGGRIRVLRHDSLLATPFLDIASHIASGGERGLLSVAFHPTYSTNHRFYVYFTNPSGDIRIVRYLVSADPDRADSTSGDTVLAVAHPQYANHNGGLVLFGPDGKLYAGLGDGGSSGDPDSNGQNRKALLGKLLRLDVDAGSPYAIPADNPFAGDTAARGEIWAYGLRNPWRFSFDRLTGNLFIGDVGQDSLEEIDVLPAGDPGGENYGWNKMEGTHCYASTTCSTSGLKLPVVEYFHNQGCAVTGGIVVRDSTVPALAGRYLYGDFCNGWVRSFLYALNLATDQRDWPALAVSGGLSSFGEDARGRVYLTTLSGRLYRIVTIP